MKQIVMLMSASALVSALVAVLLILRFPPSSPQMKSSLQAESSFFSSQIIPTKHNPSLTLEQLAEIQPGMGTVMMEYSHRFSISYYAAKANNWELANYEMEELEEIQETGEKTRPEYTEKLKVFEKEFLKPVNEAIRSKDWKQFELRFEQAKKACNACHVDMHHGYVHYQLPKEAPDFLKLDLKEE